MKPRADIFSFIHKALRQQIAEMLITIQSADLGEEAEFSAVMEQFDFHLKSLGDHGHHEDTFVFSELRKKEPALAHDLDSDHEEAHRLIDRVAAFAREMKSVPEPLARRSMAGEFTRAYVDLATFYLNHLNVEERIAAPKMHEHFSDEELEAMRNRIQASIPPEEFFAALKFGLRSSTVYELGGMLGMMKAAMPPPVIEAILQQGDVHTSPERMTAIRKIAGL